MTVGFGIGGQWQMLEEYTCPDYIDCLTIGRGQPSSVGQVCAFVRACVRAEASELMCKENWLCT